MARAGSTSTVTGTGRRSRPSQRNELRAALRLCRGSFLFAGFFSLLVNLLMLVPSIYMLAVYDRVLASGSESTLLMLTIIAVFLFLVLGGLEWVRSQILVTTSTRLDRAVAPRVLELTFMQALASGRTLTSVQPLTDVQALRQFLTGSGLFAFFDAPWAPIYVVLLYLFHPWCGIAAAVSVVVLALLAVCGELATRDLLQRANQQFIDSSQFTQRNLRNAEVIESLGMLPRVRERWQQMQENVLGLQARASTRAGVINMLSRTFRITVQSLILGLGAYLAIHKEITPGLMVAASILLGRALAPIDHMIGSWRGFVGARESYQRLNALVSASPDAAETMPLPPPKGRIDIESLVVIPPGASAPVLSGIHVGFDAPSLVAVIGPSGSGKSTFARALLGLCPAVKGCVRLDGADIRQWDRAALGPHIGYLPQDVELLDGTVAENIARFGEVDSGKVIEAAKLAGMHELILKLPHGYETFLVSGGNVLSAGQQQRVGIARALYGAPRIVVLDEPNSNLDQAGESALIATLQKLRRKQRTVIVVTHRANVLNIADRVLMLVDGRMVLFGSREEARAALARHSPRPVANAGAGGRVAGIADLTAADADHSNGQLAARGAMEN